MITEPALASNVRASGFAAYSSVSGDRGALAC
jgi:hypothetical protein